MTLAKGEAGAVTPIDPAVVLEPVNGEAARANGDEKEEKEPKALPAALDLPKADGVEAVNRLVEAGCLLILAKGDAVDVLGGSNARATAPGENGVDSSDGTGSEDEVIAGVVCGGTMPDVDRLET